MQFVFLLVHDLEEPTTAIVADDADGLERSNVTENRVSDFEFNPFEDSGMFVALFNSNFGETVGKLDGSETLQLLTAYPRRNLVFHDISDRTGLRYVGLELSTKLESVESHGSQLEAMATQLSKCTPVKLENH
jgi:hypothetical protein